MASRARTDYTELSIAQLWRLGATLQSKVIKHAGITYELTDRQLALLLRQVGFVHPGGCWMWLGARSKAGYGRFAIGNKSAGVPGIYTSAHRITYQVLRGPIPAGLTIDHLCRVTSCVKPDHLEPCTLAENIARSHRRIRRFNGA
jgi:hypothetical protein